MDPLWADIAELKELLVKAKRQSVKDRLEQLIGALEREVGEAAAAKPSCEPQKLDPEPAPAPPAAIPTPQGIPSGFAPAKAPSKPWTALTTYSFDSGKYDSDTVTVDLRLKGIENVPAENITCDFTTSSFDLKILDFEGKNWRMAQTALEKDILPAESSHRVKKNHVILTLKKEKGKYGYDSWTNLAAKGGKRKVAESAKNDDPSASLMSMMKDMYDEGDDSMKKMIGEAMMKSREGKPPAVP